MTDKIAATELELYIVNDGNLYRRNVRPTVRALVAHAARGKWDAEKAVKAFEYVAKAGSDKYKRDFGYGFDPATRRAVARELARYYVEQIREGAFDGDVAKTHAKDWPARRRLVTMPRASNPAKARPKAKAKPKARPNAKARPKAKAKPKARPKAKPKAKARLSNPEFVIVREADGALVRWPLTGALRRHSDLVIVAHHRHSDGKPYWREFRRKSRRHRIYEHTRSWQGEYPG